MTVVGEQATKVLKERQELQNVTNATMSQKVNRWANNEADTFLTLLTDEKVPPEEMFTFWKQMAIHGFKRNAER